MWNRLPSRSDVSYDAERVLEIGLGLGEELDKCRRAVEGKDTDRGYQHFLRLVLAKIRIDVSHKQKRKNVYIDEDPLPIGSPPKSRKEKSLDQLMTETETVELDPKLVVWKREIIMSYRDFKNRFKKQRVLSIESDVEELKRSEGVGRTSNGALEEPVSTSQHFPEDITVNEPQRLPTNCPPFENLDANESDGSVRCSIQSHAAVGPSTSEQAFPWDFRFATSPA